MSELAVGELCAGYGGLGMGVGQVLDAEMAWHSEIDKGALKILEHRFPGVPNIGDMTSVDWATVPRVDVLTGGTPCQDLSHAGKRAGMTEGTRSNLWVAMREAIAVLKPRLVVWENVGGAYSAAAESQPQTKVTVKRRGRQPHRTVVGGEGLLAPANGGPSLRALGRVLGDLASLGYDAGWHGLRAADVGAPHGRLRVFVVAYPSRDRLLRLCPSHDLNERDAFGDEPHRRDPLLPTPTMRDHKGRNQRDDPSCLTGALMPTPRATDGTKGGPNQRGSSGDLMLPSAVTLLPTPAVNDMGAAYTPETWDAWTDRMRVEHDNGNGHGKSLSIEAQRLLPTPEAADGSGGRSSSEVGGTRPSGAKRAVTLGTVTAPQHGAQWGDYADAITRWEHLTRPAPDPTMLSRKGTPQLSPAFSEWLMGLPAGWVTDVPGITRNEALKALGNGVVPQQAAAALAQLLAHLASEAA